MFLMGKLRVRYMKTLCTYHLCNFYVIRNCPKIKIYFKIILIGIYLPHGDITELFTIK